MSNDSIEIGLIQKKDDSQIKATLTKFKNELYVDIREYLDGEGDGYKGPTKKGVRFHSENWESFFTLMKKIDQELKKRA